MVENNTALNTLTKEGKAQLEAELKRLVEIERPQVIQDIKDARAQGDLSENAEFDAAREKQGTIEDRIREIETILQNSQVISSRTSTKKVVIGSTVVFENLNLAKKGASNNIEVQIVGSLETNPFKNKVSNTCPLGKALLNRLVGDEVRVDVKKEYRVRIVEIK